MILSGGTQNSPYGKQRIYENVPLTRDPDESQFNIWDFLRNLDFSFPEITFPGISPLLGLASGGIMLIVLIIIVMALLFIFSVFISYRFRSEDEEPVIIEEKPQPDLKELIKRRETLGKRINDIIVFLQISADEETFSEGITLGFEKLDLAMKEFSKISRPGWLTPREYAGLKIPYFNHNSMSEAVEIFYEITYGERKATLEEFTSFLFHIKSMVSDHTILQWKTDQETSGASL